MRVLLNFINILIKSNYLIFIVFLKIDLKEFHQNVDTKYKYDFFLYLLLFLKKIHFLKENFILRSLLEFKKIM